MATKPDPRTIADPGAVDAAIRWFVDSFVVREIRDRALLELLRRENGQTVENMFARLDDRFAETVEQRGFEAVVSILLDERHAFHGALGDVTRSLTSAIFVADDRSFAMWISEVGPATLCRLPR